MSNGFSKFVDRLVNEALKEVLILTEGESDERARMERALRSRYNEAEEETEATEKPIDAEKITPGAAKQRSETEQEDNDGGTGSSERPSNEPPVIEIPDEEQLMSPTYDFAKEQINSFRAGASLNNETVDSNFRKYFESLSEAEKRAVIIYSTALAQIARGMMPADDGKIRFTWAVQSLPRLILTDDKHIVKACGFSVDELDKKIKAMD